MTRDDKIKRIIEIEKAVIELEELKKEVKSRDNTKRLKLSKMNEWAKECLDNSGWVESRLRILDRYIKEGKLKIKELKLQLK